MKDVEINDLSAIWNMMNSRKTAEANPEEERPARATEVNTGEEEQPKRPARATEVNTGEEEPPKRPARATEVNTGEEEQPKRPARATEVNTGEEEQPKRPARGTEVNDNVEETTGRHTEVNTDTQINAPYPEYGEGDIIAGNNGKKYKVVSKIAKESGEAVLYRATEEGGTEEFAIKIYRREKAIKQEVVDKLMETNCPYLPKLYEVGKINQYPYEVMKFYTEGSLEGKKLSVEEIKKRLLPNIHEAFRVLHEAGIFHQDIKPSNIMKNGNSYVVMDFGISGVRKDGKSYVSQVGGFSTDYLPPSDLAMKYVSAKWDYYSLGITLYELLTGHLPYEGMEPVERMKMSRKFESELGPVLQSLNAPEDIKKLLEGLSKRTAEFRWGHEQVKLWLEGKPVVEERSEDDAPAVTNELNPPFVYEKHAYDDVDLLMQTMAQQWEKGKGYLFRGLIRRHMDKAGRPDLQNLCVDAERAKEEEQDKAYANWLYSMANDMGMLYWKENSWTLLEFGKLILEQLWKCEDNYTGENRKHVALIEEFLDTDVLTKYCNSQSDLSPEHAEVAKRVNGHVKRLRSLEFGPDYCRELYAMAYVLTGKPVLHILGKSFGGHSEFMEYMETLYQNAGMEEELKRFLEKLGIRRGQGMNIAQLELQFSCWLNAVRENEVRKNA